MQRLITTLIAANAVLAVSCANGGKPAESAPPQAVELSGSARSDTNELATRIGVEPGPVQRTEGAAAVLTAVDGEVEVRRLGEENFAAAAKDALLYTGDQLRAGEGARAELVLPDESTIELAELSTLAVGSRVATEDPASSAAVLGGVARFSVSPRAPGEGSFLVFTPAGVVATKGTVFGVGVAADGDARVGVESGAVEVAGAVSLDQPVTLEANNAVAVAADGTVDQSAAWPEDDWGSWRANAEANVDVAATANAHAEAMTKLMAQLETAYATLQDVGTHMAKFEAEAAADASAQNTAAYEARLPAATVDMDASFLEALHIEWLTYAYAAHAVLVSDLYVRHPDLEAWTKIEPRVHAAVLWPKRFEATAVAYFEPLRMQWYVHHARGRAHAALVGIAVPEFYAKVTPPSIPLAEARAKLKLSCFAAPHIAGKASARAVWAFAPSADWQAHVKAQAAAPRGKVAFWVRPPDIKGQAILGMKAKAKIASAFAVRPPQARGELKAKGGLALGHQIAIAAPDMEAAAKARASWKGELAAPSVDVPADFEGKLKGPGFKAEADAKLKGAAKAKLDAKADAKAKADAMAKGAAKAKADLAAKGKAHADGMLNVKAPEVKVKKPAVKAEAKGSAKFSLGH
jgi:hypothetical protein